MPTTTLYLIRHAEAAVDDERADPGLSPRGELQAAALARRLSAMRVDVHDDVLLHSSRRRAAATAAIVATAHAGWASRASDDVEDRTAVPEDLSAVPERYHRLLRDVPADEHDPDGRRLDAAVRSLSAIGDQDRTVVAITHAFVVGWFVRSVLDAPAWRWISLPVSNASLTVLQWQSDREPRVLSFNDTGHLA
ncbi:histidine phosphatase family protein [Agromyces sp. NPDC055658]